MSLRMTAVRYTYAGGGRPVLDGIDLELVPGSVTGLMGANDAGKSTLCLVAAGVAPATIGGKLEGSVAVDDLDTGKARPSELAQRCGVLFQNPSTQLSGIAPTVWEEVAFGPRNLSLTLDEVVERVDAALSALGIADLQERDPQRLSGGQAQLVALASVLALRPRYLVLDEPTSQLDPEGTRLVGNALAQAARATGAGILVAEHKADLLAGIVGSVVVLAGGQVVRQGDPSTVLADVGLGSLGVAPPSPVRLAHAVAEAGLALPRAGA
jgi:energy-coupling factor transporter ATP-binding protein EcfA2